MTTAPILVDRQGSIETITLHRPEAMNALDAARRGDLDALRQLPPHVLRALGIPHSAPPTTPAHLAARWNHVGVLRLCAFLWEPKLNKVIICISCYLSSFK